MSKIFNKPKINTQNWEEKEKKCSHAMKFGRKS